MEILITVVDDHVCFRIPPDTKDDVSSLAVTGVLRSTTSLVADRSSGGIFFSRLVELVAHFLILNPADPSNFRQTRVDFEGVFF